MKDLYKQVENNMDDLVDNQVWWSNCATAEQMDAAKNGSLEITLGGSKPVPKDWEELLQAFNRTYPDFRERLKRKIPKLSEQEWRMCCLIKMEVPPSTAAMLLCCTNQAISMRRVRLYQKITGEKGTPELCDSFIRDF